MAGNLIDYRVEKGVAIFELNDPPANTYTYEMNRELDECILKARMDDDVHVILMRGAGDKFFSAGANIKMLSEVTPQFKYYFCLHANETLLRLEQTPKLVIAALNGHTVGGGLEIAMAADIRIALKGAGKVGLPEVTLGVLPGTGGTQRLSRLVGKSKAIELMVEGGLFDFEEAQELGDHQLRLAGRRGREEVVGPRDGVRVELLPAEQSGARRSAASSAPCRPAGRSRSRARWPSSASCSSSSSRARTRRKGSARTTRRGSRNFKGK